MFYSLFNYVIAVVSSRWLILISVLFLLSVVNARSVSGAVTLSTVSAGVTQSLEAGQMPQGLSPTDWEGVQQAYMKASNTGMEDFFGLAVAVSGKTVVIGAYSEDSNATGVNNDQTNDSAADSGAAYVFVRSGGVWSQQAYLKPSNTGSGDQFGRSVAISGDTIVVGAHFEDSSATNINGDGTNNSAGNSGAAYVFVRSGGNWSEQAYLKSANAGTGDRFGYSVAVFGDTIVVGAYTEDSSSTGVNNPDNNLASDSGAAYIFTRSSGVWSQQAYLKASNTDPFDNFGYSVSVSGDTVMVGAPEEDSDANGIDGDQDDNSLFSVGAVYVFVRSGTTWSQQAYLKASNSDNGDVFGNSVAVSGDTAVVGARGEDSGATGVNGNELDNLTLNAGAAYVFIRSGGSWSQQAYLKASTLDAEDRFGEPVVISGNKIVIGARQEDSNATGIDGSQTDDSAGNSGAAYVFSRSGSNWTQQAYLKASNTNASDLFGFSVGISGDTVLVGAPYEDGSTTGVNHPDDNLTADSGAVYLFRESSCANQSGQWSNPTTWVSGAVPDNTHKACIAAGEKVVLDGPAAVDSLTVYPDAALDLSTFELTAENGLINHGTLSQTAVVDNTLVEFLHIQSADNSATHYRGLDIDTSANSQNLGSVEVSVRETVDWYPIMNGNGVNASQYCTNAGDSSPAYAQRCYRIAPTSQPAADVTVRLWGLTAELNGISEGNLAIYRNSPAGSSTWVELALGATTGNDGGNYSFAQASSPGFSDFLLGQSGNAPTAITLVDGQTRGRSSQGGLVFLTAVLLLSLLSFFLFHWRSRSRR